jgi:multiple antibiotic resistance protein
MCWAGDIGGYAILNELLTVFLAVYAGLFPIVDPIGNAPIFLGLTRHSSDDARRALARVVAINSFLLLMGSLFIGSYVLEFFGITLPVVRIAGGLVITALGWKLLQSGEAEDEPLDLGEDHRHMSVGDCFYPLTMPLTVGPGSISVAITLGSQRPKEAADFMHLVTVGGAAAAGLAAIGVTVYVCYRFAHKIGAVLGARGTNVMVRLSSFIVLCIGIQILWTGWKGLNATIN